MILIVDPSTEVVADHGVSWMLRSRVISPRTTRPSGTLKITYHVGLRDLGSALLRRGLPQESLQVAPDVGMLVAAAVARVEPLLDPIAFGVGRFLIRRGIDTVDLWNPRKDLPRLSDRTNIGKVIVGYYRTLHDALADAVHRSFMAREEAIPYADLDKALRVHAEELLQDVPVDGRLAGVLRAA